MRAYAFRVSCLLAGGHIETKDSEIALDLPAPIPRIIVYLPEPKAQGQNRSLVLWCGGFSSEEEARAAGTRVKTSVMLAGLLLGVGIDVGTDQIASPAMQRKDGARRAPPA
jgi:hypothetical protein